MQERNLVELVADSKYGVKTRHGFLKYHRDILAANFMHRFGRHFGYVVAVFFAVFGISEFFNVESYLSARNLTLRSLYELHYRKRSNAFAATGLAYHANYLIFRYRERYAVDGFDCSAVGKETRMQIVYFYYVVFVVHLRRVFGGGEFTTLLRLVVLHLLYVIFNYRAALFYGEIIRRLFIVFHL